MFDVGISALRIYAVSENHFWVYFSCGCQAFQDTVRFDPLPKCDDHKIIVWKDQ